MVMNQSIKMFIISALLTFPVWSLCKGSSSLELPKGWRLPSKKELGQKWREKSQAKFSSIKADLDGDGKIDQAMILVNKDGKTFGLFVWWGADKFTTSKEVYVEKEIGLLQNMGIEVSKPGTFKTACGKGYYDCPKGESEEINLFTEGIDYFQNESANSVFHWDPKEKLFKRTWMSD